jgi:hypothetical protein
MRPVQLIYVADFARMGHATSEADKHFYPYSVI